ncbi:MAG: UDP-N-acetylmuramate--L-alanine ligase [Rikenellaceae bacterium]
MKSIYFVGIGGIGMSALARYFLHQGHRVGGYDRTSSDLTRALEAEGAAVHYEDSVAMIGEEFLQREQTVVIYTPAIPADHSELNYFRANGFEVLKRSQMLGVLTEGKFVMAVAGTHGKSSTSTLLAWMNSEAEGQGCAILGAISKNFGSNLVLGSGDRVVVEADEFDRSFLRLKPDTAVITSADADHLDIYGTHEAVKEAFAQFVELIKPGGSLIIKEGVDVEIRNEAIDMWRYSYDTPCDFYVSRAELLDGGEGRYSFDIVTPDGVIEGCELGVLGWVNIENCVAATASMWCAARREGRALDHDAMRRAMRSFVGLKRRFELYHSSPNNLYMDDYAHHPREISATLSSLREMLPTREITAIFQPHLFSRTNDLYREFGEALSAADRVILLPIYPAREEPMEGVTSQLIADCVECSEVIEVADKERIAEYIESIETDVVVSFGAGDIELQCEAIATAVQAKEL